MTEDRMRTTAQSGAEMDRASNTENREGGGVHFTAAEAGLVEVESSNVSHIGYNSRSRVLLVAFRSGGVYRYLDVAPEVHADLLRAESVGRFIHKNLKGQYRFERLSPEEARAALAV